MRTVRAVAVLAVVLICGCNGRRSDAAPAGPEFAPTPAPDKGVEDARHADEAAYRFLYLPEQNRLTTDRRGEWVAIVAGRVVTATGARIEPVKTIEEADAAARAAAPDATHRFVFQVGEEGDVEWDLGGCELPNVLGTYFLADLERAGVAMSFSPTHPSLTWRQEDAVTELAVPKGDDRMHVQPEVGPPGARGAGAATYCVSSGFNGFATMSPESATGLELWEIPGVAKVDGILRSGACRRARARFSWPNTPLDFVVPVAIWPK
jgi:hypothetical protein